jgi:hypothetical protein
MVDPDILKAIEIIDKKILSLQQARNQLAQAFGVEYSSPTRVATRGSAQFNGSATGPKSRKETLAEFLIVNGPMARPDIVAQAGIPEGTVSYCLSDKRFFIQLDDGRWDATDYSRRGLQMKASSQHDQTGPSLLQTG